MRRNLSKFFCGLTLKQCWDCDYSVLKEKGMPDEQIELFKKICNNTPKGVRVVYDFYKEADALFENIYGEPVNHDGKRGEYKYPFIDAAIPDVVIECIGKPEYQKSKWHQEDLMEHVALCYANLMNEDVPQWYGRLIAVLHDVGKKYCAATNKVGEMSFYHHAECGAWMAREWTRRWYITDNSLLKEIVAIVYAHEIAKIVWPNKKDFKSGLATDHRKKFYDEQLLPYCNNDAVLAERIMENIDIFAKCDVGITSTPFSEEEKKKIELGSYQLSY